MTHALHDIAKRLRRRRLADQGPPPPAEPRLLAEPSRTPFWRRRLIHYVRMSVAFAITLALIGALAVLANAARSRVVVNLAPDIVAPGPAGSRALAVASWLYALSDPRDTAILDQKLFATADRLDREAAIATGAQRAAASYMALLNARRGRNHPLFANAKALAAETRPERRVES